MLSQADTTTPEGQAALSEMLKGMGYGPQALQLEQQFGEQAKSEEMRQLAIQESRANTARLEADRLRIMAEADPTATRTAIETFVVNDTVVTVDDRGNTVVKDVSGRVYTGDAAVAQLAAARQREVEQRRAMNQAAESGTISARMAKEAFDQASSMSTALSQYAGLIETLDDGALTGRLQRFIPTFREQTIRLQQIQTEMGLGVISATTFGSLSEGELNIAMSVNAPDLPPAELRKWYVAKIEATRKLQNALYEQAIYFSNPSATVGGWIEIQERERVRREAFEDVTNVPRSPAPPPDPDDEAARQALINDLLSKNAPAARAGATSRNRMGDPLR
jgi:hypothetical protein